MDHRKSHLLNLSRALAILENEKQVEAGCFERIRNDRKFRYKIKQPESSLKLALLRALEGKIFFHDFKIFYSLP